MIRRTLSILAGALIGPVLFAAPISGTSLTFNGLQNGEQVLTYYDGGFGSFGSGPGPLFGVSFTAGLLADSTMISVGPSALVEAPVTMDLANLWSQIVSFYFVGTGNVSFYSGPNASGALLASVPLVNAGTFGLPLGDTPGTFQSVVFSPAASGSLRVDGITFGFTVVPEPSTAVLLVAGILMPFFLHFKHNRQATPAGTRRD